MYPLPQTPLPCTSGFVPRPSSTFEPTTLATTSPVPGGVATNSVDEQQSNAMPPDSSLPHGQGTPAAPASSMYSTSQDNHTLPRQEVPTGSQNNLPAQHIISAPASTVPSTPEHRVPKSANGEGVKNSRKQGTASTSTAPSGRLCFRYKQPGHLKNVQSFLIALNARLGATFQQSVLPRGKMADSQMKDVKVSTEDLMKDTKITEKIGRKHRISLSSLTKTTDVSTVQAITGPVIVQRDSNHKHPSLAILITVQVFTKVIHNFKIFLPNSIHNKANPLLAHQPPL